jgi:dienelactone hydrolase
MADVLLFHHAQGQTAGFHAFADELTKAGHTVHMPDLFEGRTFDSIDDGLAYVQELGGFDTIVERGVRADLLSASRSLNSRGHVPRLRNPLELMLAAILELES